MLSALLALAGRALADSTWPTNQAPADIARASGRDADCAPACGVDCAPACDVDDATNADADADADADARDACTADAATDDAAADDAAVADAAADDAAVADAAADDAAVADAATGDAATGRRNFVALDDADDPELADEPVRSPLDAGASFVEDSLAASSGLFDATTVHDMEVRQQQPSRWGRIDLALTWRRIEKYGDASEPSRRHEVLVVATWRN